MDIHIETFTLKPRPSLSAQCSFHNFRVRAIAFVQILAEGHAKMVHIEYI